MNETLIQIANHYVVELSQRDSSLPRYKVIAFDNSNTYTVIPYLSPLPSFPAGANVRFVIYKPGANFDSPYDCQLNYKIGESYTVTYLNNIGGYGLQPQGTAILANPIIDYEGSADLIVYFDHPTLLSEDLIASFYSVSPKIAAPTVSVVNQVHKVNMSAQTGAYGTGTFEIKCSDGVNSGVTNKEVTFQIYDPYFVDVDYGSSTTFEEYLSVFTDTTKQFIVRCGDLTGAQTFSVSSDNSTLCDTLSISSDMVDSNGHYRIVTYVVKANKKGTLHITINETGAATRSDTYTAVVRNRPPYIVASTQNVRPGANSFTFNIGDNDDTLGSITCTAYSSTFTGISIVGTGSTRTLNYTAPDVPGYPFNGYTGTINFNVSDPSGGFFTYSITVNVRAEPINSNTPLSITGIKNVIKSCTLFLANKFQPDGIKRQITGKLGEKRSMPARISPAFNNDRSNNLSLFMYGSTTPTMYKPLDLTIHGKNYKTDYQLLHTYGYIPTDRPFKFTGKMATKDSMYEHIALAYDHRRARSLKLRLRGDLPGFNSGGDFEMVVWNASPQSDPLELFISGHQKQMLNLPLYIKGGGPTDDLPLNTMGIDKKDKFITLFIPGLPVLPKNSFIPLTTTSFNGSQDSMTLFTPGDGFGNTDNFITLFMPVEDWSKTSGDDIIPLFTTSFLGANNRITLFMPDPIFAPLNDRINLSVLGGFDKYLPLVMAGSPYLDNQITLHIFSESFEVSDVVNLLTVGRGISATGTHTLFISAPGLLNISKDISLYINSFNPSLRKTLPLFIQPTEFIDNPSAIMSLFLSRMPSAMIEMYLKNELSLTEMLNLYISNSVNITGQVPLVLPSTTAVNRAVSPLYTHGF